MKESKDDDLQSQNATSGPVERYRFCSDGRIVIRDEEGNIIYNDYPTIDDFSTIKTILLLRQLLD